MFRRYCNIVSIKRFGIRVRPQTNRFFGNHRTTGGSSGRSVRHPIIAIIMVFPPRFGAIFINLTAPPPSLNPQKFFLFLLCPRSMLAQRTAAVRRLANGIESNKSRPPQIYRLCARNPKTEISYKRMRGHGTKTLLRDWRLGKKNNKKYIYILSRSKRI